MRSLRFRLAPLTAALASLAALSTLPLACGTTDVGEQPPIPDAAPDGAEPGGDAGQDAAARDGGEAGADADARDAAPDAATDADAPDAGEDAAPDAPPPTFTVGGTLAALDADGLVLANDGRDDLAVAAGLTTFTFPTRLPTGTRYAVTVKAQPAGRACAVTAGEGTVGAANVTNVAVDCSLPASCRALKARLPGAASGLYLVDPDGPGPVAPLRVACDMDYDGGGWTLVVSTAGGAGPDTLAEGEVAPGDAKYVSPDVLSALALGASQVHVRTPGAAATESVTSVADAEPIQNLRQRLVANEGLLGLTAAEQAARWTGPFATPERLGFTCATAGAGYPAVYWACGNTEGLHLIGAHSRWIWVRNDPAALNVPLETWLR